MMSIQNGYKGIDVSIINYTKHPAKIMWDMLKQTWIELQDIEYDPDNKTVRDFIIGCIDKRLNPTPQETILIQVIFKGISRVNLAQLTRHRGWLFNSESQMPQHVKHNVILPLNIVNSEFYERAVKLIEESQKLYDDMTAGNESKETTGIPYQDARYLLMHGQTADISASFTLPQLVNVSGQRLENNTADEINYAFRILIKKLAETIIEDTEMDELDKFVYYRNLGKCDCFGAAQKKCFICDDVFGNSFKRFPDGNEHVTKATENCKSDFKKSAWYAELKRIYEEEPTLLLPGEREMISSWED
jgi:thymidylate synthase ThyX